MDTIRAAEIYDDGRFRLIAVESARFGHSKTNTGCLMYGKLELVTIIVSAPEGTCALDSDARPIALDKLKQDIPGLDIAIAPLGDPG